MNRKVCSILLLPILFLSCGPKDTSTEIQFWNFGGTQPFLKWVRTRVEQFNRTHPGIRVVQTDKSWNMIREILYANYSAGAGPDVMTVHANYSAEFGGTGFFYPINKFPDFEEVKTWYQPNLFESVRYKNNYYGLPGSAIAFVLACNKDLFDQAGVAPPKTWSEFRSAAKKLTRDVDGDGTIDQYGLVLLGGDRGGFSYRLVPFFFKAGVRILSDDLSAVRFNSPRAVAALTMFAEMYQDDHSITPGFLAYSHTEVNDLFSSNHVAMAIEGPWFRGIVHEKSPGKEMYIVPIPVPDDMLDQYGTAPTLQDMVMYTVSAHSKNLPAAWEFVKFLRNKEADMEWLRQDMGAVATTLHALNSPEAESYPEIALYRNELSHAIPWPPHPGIIPIANNVIAPYGQKAIVGDLTPAQALEGAAREAQEILKTIR